MTKASKIKVTPLDAVKGSSSATAAAAACIAAMSKGDLSTKIRIGICGLPNVGKSSLFNALARRSQAQAENYPFCTIEPNVAQIAIPDPYLDRLAHLAKSTKAIPAHLEFVDVAGLVAGASRGEGLGNKFLANIRECEAIVHVLRNYDDGRVVHVNSEIDPKKDAEIINTELQLADLAHIERRLERSNCTGEERDALESLLPKMKEGIPARSCGLVPAAAFAIKSLGLLTLKPVLYAFNVSRHAFLFERDGALEEAKKLVKSIRFSDPSQDLCAIVSAKLEARLSKLNEEERIEHMQKLGVDKSLIANVDRNMCYNSLPKLISELLHLGLVYTGPGVASSRSLSTKAYVIRRTGAPTAIQMAGKLHGDIQKGFIKCEVISAEKLLEYSTYAAAHLAGAVVIHGKSYVLQCNDVILIKYK